MRLTKRLSDFVNGKKIKNAVSTNLMGCVNKKYIKYSVSENRPRMNENQPNGISVHWLKYGFLKEVKKAGFNESSTIYDIENLNTANYGVIRQKGAHQRCPRDGKIGAAYVDCLTEMEYIGPADMMLTYGWGNTVGEIVETLTDYCSTNELDPLHTYVWICCLCINQHRVHDKRTNGISTSVDDFQDIYKKSAANIGHVVALMAPWRKPICLTRAWCIFEMHAAIENKECKLTIAMPPREREDMMESLGDMNHLFDAISKTNIKKAKTSIKADKTRLMDIVEEFRILDIVQELPASTRLSNRVSEWVREHVKDYVRDQVYAYEREQQGDITTDLKFADLCRNVGSVMSKGGRPDDAIFLYRNALKIREQDWNNLCHRAELHNEIGSVILYDKNDHDEALLEYKLAVIIYEEVLGKSHPDTASSYCRVAKVLDLKGDYDGALVEYRKAGNIYEQVLGTHHPFTATLYNNIGLIMDGKGDHDNALEEFRKALLIEELIYGKEHPTTSATYNNIGGALYEKGSIDLALIEFKKAHAINVKTLGKDHAFTVITSGWITKLSGEVKEKSVWATVFNKVEFRG